MHNLLMFSSNMRIATCQACDRTGMRIGIIDGARVGLTWKMTDSGVFVDLRAVMSLRRRSGMFVLLLLLLLGQTLLRR